MTATAILAKSCKGCRQLKALGDFYKHVHAKDGLQASCKSCCKALTAAYRTANPDKIKAGSAHRSNHKQTYNPDKARVASAIYRALHPDRVKASQAAHIAANPGRHKDRVLAWRAANPEAVTIHHANRRARTHAAGGTLSKGLSVQLFKLQGGMCPCCKQPLGDDYHLDHIHPLALGGSNTDENIQLLRAICNLQKHAKHPVDFMQSRGFLL